MVLPQRMAGQHWDMLFEIHFGEIKNAFGPEKAAQTLGIVISNSFWRHKKCLCSREGCPNMGDCYLKLMFAK